MKLTIRNKLFVLLTYSWLIIWGFMLYSAFHVKDLRLQERQTQLSIAMQMAHSIATDYTRLVEADRMTESEAQREAMRSITNLRFGENGYFTVLGPDTILAHPLNQSLPGKRHEEIKDSKGNVIYGDGYRAALKNGSGYFSYFWPRPNETEPSEKMSSAIHFAPWNWGMATGLYIKDIEQAFRADLIKYGALGMSLGLVLNLVVFLIGRGMTRSLGCEPEFAARIAARIAQGDLATPVDAGKASQDSLLAAMSAMQNSLQNIVSRVRQGTETISSSAEQIAAGNLDLSSRTEEQASSLEETAASMEELTATVKNNAEHAYMANQLAGTASDVAGKGGAVMTDVIDTMDGIKDSARKIADIISVIDSIAFQTNILALNAAVEAARAGEQGRGFAVVATEVRTLAQRSAAAAREIKELIGDSVDKVEAGNVLVQKAGATMEEIVGSIQKVTDILGEITSASAEQAAGINQVNQAIAQIDQVTQQNAALVEEAAASADAMKEQAQQLVAAVSTFKLEEAAR